MVHAVAVAPGSGSSDANSLGFISRSAPLRLLALLLALLFGLTACSSDDEAQAPNILFVIMDDVGIDQMRAFGYGGDTPPATPNIDRIADAGIRFTNTWSMPACSTSRAVFFSGRFPLRTNVFGALGPSDLANSMVSPYETSLPKLMKQSSYQSALFGKFHLGLQGNSPYAYAMPHSLGWDYFEGWLDATGDPSSIDRTAGGVATGAASYPCGFVPGAAQGRGRQRRLLCRRRQLPTDAAGAGRAAGTKLSRQRRHLRSEPALPESTPGEHRLSDAERALRLAAGHQ
jgi:hypothetical protein